MKKKCNLIIFGCGGHARSIADIAVSIGIDNIIFVDQNAKENEFILGFPVVTAENIPSINSDLYAIAASGNNNTRDMQLNNIQAMGALKLTSIISNKASIGLNSLINLGVFVGNHAHIGPRSNIGRGSIINTAAIIEHDCSVGQLTHISVGAKICGNTIVGANCFLGAGATIIDDIKICDNVIIGAGAVIIHDIIEPGTYIGVPGKLISSTGN